MPAGTCAEGHCGGFSRLSGFLRSESTSSKLCIVIPSLTLAILLVSDVSQHTQFSLFVTVNGSGRVTSEPPGISCPGRCVAKFNGGTSVVLSESTSGTFVGWSGDCKADGSCSVTMRAKRSVAAIFGENRTGVWSVTNQQPVTQQFYAGSIFTTPLPADAGTHLYPYSDAIIHNVFKGNSGNASTTITSTLPNNGGHCGMGNSFYYSSQSDPIYKIEACRYTGPNRRFSPSGKYFHFTNQAMYSSDTCDMGMVIWDQSNDLDPTIGGRIFVTYRYSTAPAGTIAQLPSCSCTTKACADKTPNCEINNHDVCLQGFPGNDSVAYNEGDGYASSFWAAGVGYLRLAELTSQTIHHFIGINTTCLRSTNGNGVADPPVFPAFANAIGCKFVDKLRPLNGNLIWIDSGYKCSTLPLWQRGVCVAIQTYGAYLHDTGGDSEGFFIPGIEGGEAASTAGVNSPFFNNLHTLTPAAILSLDTVTCPGGRFPKVCTGTNGLAVIQDTATSATKVNMPFFNMPGVLPHLHIVDPCIPRRMAHQPGAC